MVMNDKPEGLERCKSRVKGAESSGRASEGWCKYIGRRSSGSETSGERQMCTKGGGVAVQKKNGRRGA